MQGFVQPLGGITWVGHDLSRPECVLTTGSGDLYVSDNRGGVSQIRPDGSVRHFHGRSPEGEPLGANGFAMLQDGSFLIAPVGGGGVYRLHRDGRAALFLDEADGQPLRNANFVLLDTQGRLWICALSRQDRKTTNVFPRDLCEGSIVLVDHRGARIVADNIRCPNEVRVDATGRWLYTNETFGGRLLRYPIAADGSLGGPEVVCELDVSNMLDGFTLDSEGGAWLTALVSNRLWYVAPGGAARVVLEDSDAARVARLAAFQASTGVDRRFLYEADTTTLRNISSVAFGGPDLRTVFLGSLGGSRVPSFRVPVAGMRPAHWNYGPFD